MALAETAELAVKLTLDDSQFGRALRGIDSRLNGIGRTAKTVGKGIAVGLGVTATAGAFLLVDALRDGMTELRELETATAQTEAVIKSTGGAAGVTADQVRTLAEKYEDLNATIDDKVIQSAENLLLTFTKIGKDAFEPTLEATLDMATALGIDATSAAKLLGKALQDPEKGLARLERQIGPLDADTKKHIKTLMEQGDIYGAQKVLLDELTTRYGGSFARAGETAAGKQARLADKIDEVQKALASKLLPVVTKVADRLANYLAKPETLAFFERLSATIAGLFTDENLDAAASAMETAAKAVSGAIGLFNQLPPEIKALAIGAFAVNKVTGGAVGGAAEAFGKLLGAGLKQIFAANVTVIGGNVTGGGIGGPVAGGGKGVIGKAAGVASAATKVVVPLAVGIAIAESIKTASGQSDTEWQGRVEENLKRLGGFGSTINDNTGKTAAEVTRAKNEITANERGEGAKHRAAIDRVKAKQAESLIAFRAGERATLTGNSLQRTANERLAQIRAKKTNFRVINNIGITTRVSVSELQRQAKYTSRVARSTSLSAS